MDLAADEAPSSARANRAPITARNSNPPITNEYRKNGLWLKSVRFHPQSLQAASDNGLYRPVRSDHGDQDWRGVFRLCYRVREIPEDARPAAQRTICLGDAGCPVEEREKPRNRRRSEFDALVEE
jgi:hypothetical protein